MAAMLTQATELGAIAQDVIAGTEKFAPFSVGIKIPSAGNPIRRGPAAMASFRGKDIIEIPDRE